MRLTSYINNQKCLEWGLNLQQGALFDLLNQLSGWAEPIYIDGAVYYWVAKSKICEELPVAYSKPDTAYRALKVLEEKGLIIYIKFGSKDCVSLTEKGKEWNSEINPNLGNKSEQTRKNIREISEKNPTYKTTKDNSTIDNKTYSASDDTPSVSVGEKNKFNPLEELIKRGANEQHAKDFIATRKAKRMAITLSVINSTEREGKKAGYSFAEVIELCAENGWGGFKSHYSPLVPTGNQTRNHQVQGDYSGNSDKVPSFME